MSAFVLDASVAGAALIPEAVSERCAAFLRAGHDLSVPDVFFAEVANALRKRRQRGDIDRHDLNDGLDWLVDVSLDVAPTRPLVAEACALALALSHSIYDCLYLTLAVGLEAPLVTADRRLLERLAGSKLEPLALWIGDVA